jgi:hypothetical protein
MAEALDPATSAWE